MSKVSIYENSWIDLVFERKNQDYGAYQLRQETSKTSIIALFSGVLFIVSLISIPVIFGSAHKVEVEVPTIPDFIIEVSNILPNQPDKPEKLIAPTTKEPEEINEKEPLVNPEIVRPIDANEDIATNKENTTPTVTPAGTGTVGTNTGTTSGPGTAPNNSPDTGNTIVTTVSLDKLPEFPGGMNRFYTYVGNNFEKPEIGDEKTIRVHVSFVIEKDGSMTDIQVNRDPGYGLGKEAIRVLKSLRTKWKPGMIDGKAVRTSYTLPIAVQLE